MQKNIDAQQQDGAIAKAASATARLVQYAPGRLVALPPHTTLEVLEFPKPVPVPGGAYYAQGLLTWQDKRIPMIDLLSLLKAHPQARPMPESRYALVVAHQDTADGTLREGAIGMDVLPQSVVISDASRCELPADSDLWPLLAIACFEYEGKPVPVIDTGRLFAAFHG